MNAMYTTIPTDDAHAEIENTSMAQAPNTPSSPHDSPMEHIGLYEMDLRDPWADWPISEPATATPPSSQQPVAGLKDSYELFMAGIDEYCMDRAVAESIETASRHQPMYPYCEEQEEIMMRCAVWASLTELGRWDNGWFVE